MKKTDNALPFATALKQTIRGYNFSTFRHDALAALVVSLVALPLSMALAIAVGLPPQHGIYTAIVAGIAVPLLGGSIWQVSGPTAAFVVILAPIVAEFGLRGIIWATLLAGIFLLLFAFARLGRLINYVPYPVTTGFTAGIAIVLAILSLNDFLGLRIESLEGSFVEKVTTLITYLPNFDLPTFFIGCITLVLLFTSGRIIKFLPSTIIAILVGTSLAILFSYLGFDIETIGSRFSYITPTGIELPGIPPYLPHFHLPIFSSDMLFSLPSFEELRQLLFPALTIAILAALESLLSATVADSLAGTKHNPNAELNGIGIGNILSALASGIPATGAIARTSILIHNGAKTPLASSLHAILIAVYVLIFASYINYIPMASLAALLIHTAYRMSHYKQFIRTIQIAARSDVVVLLICFTLTVFIDMVAGVGVGMVCAAFLLIRHISELTKVELESFESSGEESISRPLPPGVLVYRIRGPLFFGTIEKAFDRYNFAHDYVDTFIVDISDVPFIDMTGLVAMKSMIISIAHEKRLVYIVSNVSRVVDKIKQKIKDHHVSRFVQFYADIDMALTKRDQSLTSKESI